MPELTEEEYMREIDKFLMMVFPDPDDIRKFCGALPNGKPMSDDGALGAVHKARVLELSRMVSESIEWLEAHDIANSYQPCRS